MIETFTKTTAGRKHWDGTVRPGRQIEMVRGTIAGIHTFTAAQTGQTQADGWLLEDGRIMDHSAVLGGVPAEWAPTARLSTATVYPDMLAALIAAGATVEAPATRVRAA